MKAECVGCIRSKSMKGRVELSFIFKVGVLTVVLAQREALAGNICNGLYESATSGTE
jgi:hypothetical protein